MIVHDKKILFFVLVCQYHIQGGIIRISPSTFNSLGDGSLLVILRQTPALLHRDTRTRTGRPVRGNLFPSIRSNY